jgi:hypothetical protein
MKMIIRALSGFLLLGAAAVQAQFDCATNSGTITIIGYHGKERAITIPAAINGLPVTSIGNRAFDTFGYSQAPGSPEPILSVVLPDGITRIGDQAFSGCGQLTNVMIPGSVTQIGDRAFESCESLTKIIIPF